MTSSTEEELKLNRVLNRPWILEKSSPLILVMLSIASWEVTMTQTLPPHFVPISSTMVCKFNIRSESEPIYWPTSSIINNRRLSFPLLSTYSLISLTSCSMLSSISSSPLNQLRAAVSLMPSASHIAATMSSSKKEKEFRELSHEPPLIRSKLFWNGSVFPDFAINCSNLAIFKSLP